jgi:hypothetical protein
MARRCRLRPVVARLLDVELGAEVLLDGALVYVERVAAAHMQL